MESGSFVRRIVFALYFIVIATIFVVAGVAGLFGSIVQTWLVARVITVQQLYGDHKAVFDWSILIIGSSVPAVTGVLAILKGFYYAERNLPIRLHELVENAKQSHLKERPVLLEFVRTPIDRKEFLVSPIYSNPFSRLARTLGFSSTYYKVKEFASSINVLEDEIKTLLARTAEIQERKVTGHLIRGSHFAALANGFTPDTPEWRKEVEEALTEYKAALRIRPNDLDALEGAADQFRALGDDTEGLKVLVKVASAAVQEDKPLQHAKALREIAAIHDRRSSAKDWETARSRLVTAKELLRHRLVYGQPEVLEMARVELLYGEVQTKREKFSAAKEALDHAGELFSTLKDAEGQALVKDAIKRLEVAARDKEAPGV